MPRPIKRRFNKMPNETMKQHKTIPFSIQEICQQLKEQAYISVPFTVGKDTIEKIMNSFMAFLGEPDSIKNQIYFQLSTSNPPEEVGLIYRNPKDGKDDKVYFHFHPAMLDQYQGLIASNAVVKEFVDNALLIWEKVRNTIYELLEILSDAYPGVLQTIFNEETGNKEKIIIRFLKYNWQKRDQKLAKSHHDRGGFTLTLWTNKPGLRIGEDEKTLTLMPYTDKKAYFMLGQAAPSIGIDDLPLGWHDVIQVAETKEEMPGTRWSIVAFINP